MSTQLEVGHVHTTESDLRDGRKRRRRHSDEFKARMIAERAWHGVGARKF